jgi:hypothetical protein
VTAVRYAQTPNRWGITFRMLRAWSPLVVPATAWVLLLALAVALTRHPAGHVAIPSVRVGQLAILLLAVGVGFGVVLRSAASDVGWMALVASGVGVEVVLSALVLFGPLASVMAALVLLVGSSLIVQGYLRPVAPDSVQVTALADAYSRTLLPGRNVLAPGERVVAVVPTGTREHITVPQRVQGGEGWSAQAAARVSYRVVPAEAHRAVRDGPDWERGFQRRVAASVRRELEDYLRDAGGWARHRMMKRHLDVTWSARCAH